jgi:Splicing factor SF3a60 binding domain
VVFFLIFFFQKKGANIFGSFYESLQSSREYHQKFPNVSVDSSGLSLDMDIEVAFSGEEIFGKYLGLWYS